MIKASAIVTPLQPHQEEAVQRALRGDLILAHSTGSGKTLTSIAAADAIDKPVVVLTPASLVENFKKELRKHKKGGPRVEVMSLPTAVKRNYQIPEGSTLIVDEAHSLRNTGTARQQYVKEQAGRAGRVLALTGTPAYNQISDWAPLVNIVARRRVVPELPADFQAQYIRQLRVVPRLSQRLSGVEPGLLEKLVRTQDLKAKLAPYVDVFDTDVEKPVRRDEDVYVDMSKDQLDAYKFVQDRLPPSIRAKIRANLPPSKAEARMLNAFLTGLRQTANTAEGFVPTAEPGEKMKKAVELLRRFQEENPEQHRALVYSNFLESGVDSYAKLLDKAGIPYGRYTGKLSGKEKKALVDSYNKGDIDVLLASGAGSEGLDLKNTRLIQLLEPHWNESRTDQVIGRGIRYKSHEGLPLDQRNVLVQHFYSQLPKDRTWFFKRVRPASVDEYLRDRAKEKQQLIDSVKRLFTTKE